MPDRHAEIYGSPAIAYGRIYLSTEAGIFSIGDPSAPFSGEGFRIPPELRDRFRDRPLEEICDRLADADRLPEDNEDIHRLLLRCGLIDG